jgi:hypothetical protein
MDEKLVVFRDKSGRVGCLNFTAAIKTSLEFGIPATSKSAATTAG